MEVLLKDQLVLLLLKRLLLLKLAGASFRVEREARALPVRCRCVGVVYRNGSLAKGTLRLEVGFVVLSVFLAHLAGLVLVVHLVYLPHEVVLFHEELPYLVNVFVVQEGVKDTHDQLERCD